MVLPLNKYRPGASLLTHSLKMQPARPQYMYRAGC
ncbi:hypothetical protein MTY_0704 [Moorella thermoacetica Y72]|uniref:Uncharacterized protein n=1 Tax=Moorella thermoacetica Y72 TaxID=1325331 RepID=A0A0S6UEF5_NEOTH|nr:hypothetical protein MTY_0704 [Moorella thermoacetica Y72]